jgi:hypothetical protein
MNTRRLASIVAMPLMIFAAAPAVADAPVGTELRLTAVVPTICQVAFGSTMVAPNSGEVDLGTMTRFCNDGEGYRVVLHTPQGLNGATFVVGSKRIALSGTGETVVIDSTAPELASESAHIEFAGGTMPEGFNLGISTQPKGMTY